jgi:hypothetical protein
MHSLAVLLPVLCGVLPQAVFSFYHGDLAFRQRYQAGTEPAGNGETGPDFAILLHRRWHTMHTKQNSAGSLHFAGLPAARLPEQLAAIRGIVGTGMAR